MDLPIGQAIRDLRIYRGLSQADLADRMGCERQFINKHEQNKHTPVMDTFDRFAIALNIQPWKLLRYAQKLRKQMEAK